MPISLIDVKRTFIQKIICREGRKKTQKQKIVLKPPLPLGEGWGEGKRVSLLLKTPLILTFSQREKGLKTFFSL